MSAELDQAVEKLVREAAERVGNEIAYGGMLVAPWVVKLIEQAFLAPMQEFVREQVALAVAGAYEAAALHYPLVWRRDQHLWISCGCGWNKDGEVYKGIAVPHGSKWVEHIRALTPLDAHKAQAERMQKLAALAEKWRKNAEFPFTINPTWNHALAMRTLACADELEAKLREMEGK